MSRDIHFLNHTSFVLEYDSYFLLLDPWPSESLAFESWKPNPPCFLNENLLSAFINASKSKAGIVISHGHDDHCDDSFLKKISPSTNVFYPNYKSKGSLRRLHGNGLDKVTEINSLDFVNFGPFSMSTFIIKEHSHDDAVFIIKTDQYVLVHANDNSVPFPQVLIDFIILEAAEKKIYFASQTGIANGYQYCYPQFMEDKGINAMEDVVIGKTTRTIQVAIDNAIAVDAKNFITYAAYTISIPLLEKFKGSVQQFFPSPANIDCLDLKWGDLKLLDFVPGDSLQTADDEIRRPFWMKAHGIEKIAAELKVNIEQTLVPFNGRFKDELARLPEVNSEELLIHLKNYLDGFYKHVSKLENFWKDEIVNKTLLFRVTDVGEVCIDLRNGVYLSEPYDIKINKKIEIEREVLLLMVAGVFNFESLYIGHHAIFERYPMEKYNHELMMQLQVYGYIYQKRMVPEEFVPVKQKSQSC